MIEAKHLASGDKVAMFPFQGVPYEKPSDEVIVDEEDINEVLLSLEKDSRGHGLEQIIIHLKKRGLLPLRYNSPQLPYLIKALGYVFGDGTIYFTNSRGKGVTWFWGKPEDLEAIRKDIAEIGFTPSRVYIRDRECNITTAYNTYEFKTKEASFKVVSSGFAALLNALGAPIGNKAKQNYNVPAWLFEAPLWQQRLFLAAFFGAELSSPRAYDERNHNFMPPLLSLNKREDYIENGRTFLGSISRLLNGFGVKTNKISQRKEQTNADGRPSYRLQLVLSSRPESLVNLWSKVGFEYNRARRVQANMAAQYLKLKLSVWDTRRKASRQARELVAAGVPVAEVKRELVGAHVDAGFLTYRLQTEEDVEIRVGADFDTFEDYVTSCAVGETGMVWERIASIEQIPFDDYVYDFTVEHPHHNFIANGFVVSNCGVRLMRTDLTKDEALPKIEQLVKSLFDHVPCGVGSEGRISISHSEEREMLATGSRWIIEKGYGWEEDLEHTEEGGCLKTANPEAVSTRALERGAGQLGTLGSGNHFLEVQMVAEVYDEEAAQAFGLFKGGITVMIHSGSRGFGYQVCDDFLATMGKAMAKYQIQVPDRQLACVPVESPEGESYLGAMACAANYAWTNRQAMAHLARKAFEKVFGADARNMGMRLVYDVAHNIAKFERYNVDGRERQLCIHRKGATRSFPTNRSEIPADYRKVGQPVLIPGDMGRSSYVLVGTELAMEETFGTSCHGAGRVLGRNQAMKVAKGRSINKELADVGVIVKARSPKTLAEEMPEAYKDVSEVVNVVHNAGIAKRVARLKPLGVIKG
jgi:tRNA-splicing ligase RtcB